MAIRRSLKTIGTATILALALGVGMTWATGEKGHEGMEHKGMKHEAMKAHHEKMGQWVKQLTEHTQMMKGVQDHDQLGQEMIKHQEMIDQIMNEMVEHHKAMGEMMGGQHGGAEGKGHSHKGGKGSMMKPGGGMMEHGSGGMMQHKEPSEQE